MKQLVLATGNPGKLEEIRALLGVLKTEVRAQSEFDVDEAEETGLTFIENALIKARNASRRTGLPALADDSGLEVDALNGAPGIRSARFAGPDACDEDNNQALLEALYGVPEDQRTARYQCLLVLMQHWRDPTPAIFQGTWDGVILMSPRGSGGFGYDPLFRPRGLEVSAAELSPADKNRQSHRGHALRALQAALTGTSR